MRAFKNVLKGIKDLIMWPIKTFRDREYLDGALISTMYATAIGAVVLVSSLITYTIRNPTYSYEDKDPQTKNIVKVDVVPTKGYVTYSLSNGFERAANFKTRKFYDVSVTKTSDYDVIPVTNSGGGTGVILTPSSSDKVTYTNERSFDEAMKTPEDSLAIVKMEGYWKKANIAHSR